MLAAAIAIALVWSALVYHLESGRAAIIEQAHRDVQNLSIGVEKHVERLLVGVDQVMRFIAADFARDPETFDFNAWLQRSTSLEGVTNQMSLYNESGELLASRTPMAPGMPRFNIRDRAYFQALAAQPDAGLYVDRTLKGRITGRYVLQTARRLNRRDGGFAGVIVTSIDPDYLSEQFRAIDVGRHGSVAMFGHDGYIRARYPNTQGIYELNATSLVSGKGVFAHLKERSSGTYEIESAFDHVTRVFGYRTIGSLPMIVTVGQSLDEIMEPFEAERARAIAAGVGMTLLLLALLALRLRVITRDRRHAAALALANGTLADRETEARRAEAQAHEANRVLTLAAQIAHIGHWRVLLPENVLSWSAEVFSIHGRDAAGAPPSVDEAIAAYHPDDRQHVARCVAEAVRSGTGYGFNARILRPDGSVRDIVSRGLCELGPDGSVQALFGTIMDVTELRRIERAALESEHRYRMLAENSGDMITHMELTGRRLFVSPGSRGLLGYEPEALVGTNPLETMHPDDAAGLRGVFEDLAAGRRAHALNVNRLRHRDGHWIWVEAALKLMRSSEGVPTGIIAALRDVTDRMHAEDALRESEQRYRLLAENTSELIMLGRDDGSRAYISPASERLLGFTPGELAAMRLRDYVHPDDLARLYAATASLGRGAAQAACIYRALHKSGGWVTVEGSFRRIPDAGADEPSIVATFRDVSTRERQARLLEEAKAEAESGARVKAEFLANMSHELRTPLTGMLGVHDLLRADPNLSGPQHRLVDLAQEAGHSLLAIVNDILDFSKIEAGQLNLETLPFGLRALMDGCRELAEEGIKSNAVVLRVEVAEDAPDWLMGDPTRLRQVLLNLTTNAAKFTSEGSVTLSARYDAAAARLRVAVTDTGIGIPADKLPMLFERFSQADTSMSRRYGGTGLGLAICKRLVTLMGGEIGVTSVLGRGSTFWFEVPLPRAEVREERAPRRNLLTLAAARTFRLLVAEDNRMNQEIIQTVLTRKGHDVVLVGDGFAAVAAFKAGPAFDLVLMDVQMPGLDGIEATGAIRAWETAEGRRPTPIIALTANAMAEEAARCRQAGMSDHVAKPIAWATLFAAMERFAEPSERRPNRDAAPQDAPEAAPVLDREVLDGVAELLGTERFTRLLANFVEDVGQRLRVIESPAATAADIAMNAHALVSQAGQLGFLELSAIAAQIEECVQSGGDTSQLNRLREAAGRATEAVTTSAYTQAA